MESRVITETKTNPDLLSFISEEKIKSLILRLKSTFSMDDMLEDFATELEINVTTVLNKNFQTLKALMDKSEDPQALLEYLTFKIAHKEATKLKRKYKDFLCEKDKDSAKKFFEEEEEKRKNKDEKDDKRKENKDEKDDKKKEKKDEKDEERKME